MLRIDNLEISQNNNLLLSADYLNLNAGEKAVIVGNNDSGKSLLLKAIHGNYSNYKGNIFIKEKANVFYKKKKQTIHIDNTSRILENETIWKNLILPYPSLTARTKQKITRFCENTGLNTILEQKAKHTSNSALKMTEIIRAVIQLPYIILIDDIDIFFDNVKMMKIMEILNYAASNGSCVLVTAKERLDDFDLIYRIQNGKLVKL